MKYGSIYLVVRDFDKSLDFYEKILEMKVSATNGKRFAIFNNDGLNLCLLNGYYDELYPEKKETNDDGLCFRKRAEIIYGGIQYEKQRTGRNRPAKRHHEKLQGNHCKSQRSDRLGRTKGTLDRLHSA